MITDEEIEEFRENGIVVIENVLSPEEVQCARRSLHEDVYKYTGIAHQSENWSDIGARLKGPANKINYAKWKLLNINLNPNSVYTHNKLLSATYGPGNIPGFEHPYQAFDKSFCFVDRVCYRLPDTAHKEGGLALHLDRNPHDPYLQQAGGLDRWRPIQSFICLTDHIDSDSGGLRVVPGFHLHIEDYFRGNREAEAATGTRGEFFRMHGKSHTKLNKQLQSVYAPAGSLVLWDSRLPHSTSDTLGGYDSREVVYSGFLPDIPLNRAYVTDQRGKLLSNRYTKYGPQDISADRDWEVEELTAEQREALGFLL